MARPGPAAAVLRRFPVVVAGLLFGTALALLALSRLPPLYEAEAALLVELAADHGETVSALSFDASDLLPLLEQRMQARAISAEVATRLAAARTTTGQDSAALPNATAPEGSFAPDPAAVPDETQARIVTLRLLAPGAQRAAAATNEVTGLLLREAAQRRHGAGERPATADEEIERLGRELEARGAALRAFLAEREDALPDSLDARRLALATEEERLTELARAQAALAIPAGSGTDEVAAGEAGGADDGSHRALVEAQRAEAEARIADLRRSIIATPANTANLAELRGRFEVLRSEFDRVTQQRAAAEAGDLVAVLSGSPRVSVLALATPPGAAASPGRLLILVAGVGGGLLLGLGLALLLDTKDRSIRHPEEIASRLGLEPFAALPVLRSRHRTRGRRLGWTVVLVAIVGIALWIVHSRIMPMDLLVGRLLEALRSASGPAG